MISPSDKPPHLLTFRIAGKRQYVRGDKMRRYADAHPANGTRRRQFKPPLTHAAAEESRTRFPKSRRDPGDNGVLKSGHNSAKIGAFAIKGPWRFPIYTLTLEERATCPPDCAQWLNCYGNNMPFAHRIAHGSELIDALAVELRRLARRHQTGFIVRLHVLGDFYDVQYAMWWKAQLSEIPQLHIYGYTAHKPWSPIGMVLRHMGNRAKIRFSNQADWADLDATNGATVTIRDVSQKPKGAVVCPAQLPHPRKPGKTLTDCCGTCALCWTTEKTVAFLEH